MAKITSEFKVSPLAARAFGNIGIQQCSQVSTQSLDPAAAGGAIDAIQTYGDPLNVHPHLHSLVSNGVWDRQEQFQPFGPLAPQPGRSLQG
ncbi:MAG: transposase [Acidobacteriota bacterium]